MRLQICCNLAEADLQGERWDLMLWDDKNFAAFEYGSYHLNLNCSAWSHCKIIVLPHFTNSASRYQTTAAESHVVMVKWTFRQFTNAVAYWLRHYSTNRKVAGSIPDEVNF
jgi:hypothetical protein